MTRLTLAAVACVLLGIGLVSAQAPPAQGGGRIGGAGIGAYPNRPAADAAALERGRAAYSTNCAFCHGADTRGGDGGPSLLRSGLVLDDQNGELIGPVVTNGRVDRGMPKFSLTGAQITDIATFVHSFRVAGYDNSRNQPPTIVVGDAKAGEAYFAGKCASCHGPTQRNLSGIASRITNARTLQQIWLMPGSIAGRGAPVPMNNTPPRARVTLPSGAQVDGEIERLDDFHVALRKADGSRVAWPIVDGKPKVEVVDPLQAHRDLLKTYTDADIHNVTAYLVTLK